MSYSTSFFYYILFYLTCHLFMVQRSQKLNFAPPTQSKKLCNAFYLTLLYSSLLVPLEVGRTIRFLPRETLDPFLRFYIYIFIFYILYLSKIQLRARSHWGMNRSDKKKLASGSKSDFLLNVWISWLISVPLIKWSY